MQDDELPMYVESKQELDTVLEGVWITSGERSYLIK
jgi:hypothetical protein